MSTTANVVIAYTKKRGSKSRKWAVSTGKAGGFGGSNHKWRKKGVSYTDAVAYWNRFVRKKIKKASADQEYCWKIVK